MLEILNNAQIEQKVNRLAHQLIENTFEEKEIFIGGITGNGFFVFEYTGNGSGGPTTTMQIDDIVIN